MANLVLRKFAYAALLCFATLIAAFSINPTTANAATCTQSATLAINGSFTTPDLGVVCVDTTGAGLYFNAADAMAFANQIGYLYPDYLPGAVQTVTTTNATYSFLWNGSTPSTYVDTYVITLVSVGHNASPDVPSTNLNGAAGVDSFTLWDDDSNTSTPTAYTVPFAITIPASVPTVTSISPVSGTTAGGTSVAVTGTGFTSGASVKFGSTAAASVTFNSATSITATSPAGSAGTVDVTVTTAGGTSATSASDHFTYIAPPTVTSLSPSAGPTAGSTSVAITGTNFTGATSVKFGATTASFIFNSPTSITATSPAGLAGTVDVTVTTVGGTSATSASDQFTYVAAPTLTSISPSAGPTAGGTTVAITGTNFSGATSVKFGGTTAGFIVNSSTSITATSPVKSAGLIDVTVTTAGGTSATSASDQFTYIAPPIVTTNPSDQIVTAGSTASFTAAASGTAPTVQWQGSTNGGASFSDLSGENATTLSFTAQLAQTGYQYRAVFTNSAGTATTSAATLTVNPGPATHFTVSAPANATAGTGFTITVTALDAFNNTATGYVGTVHFTSADPQAVLPANATLSSGVGTFSVTLKTAGNQSVTATDMVTSSITGTIGVSVVAGAPATVALVTGSSQFTPILSAFTNPLVAKVTDVGGNAISGATVTFTAPAQSGASVTFAGGVNTAVTNVSGVATSVAITANGNAGGFNVVASSGAATTASFALTNTQATQTISFGANPGPVTFAPASTFAVSATGGASGNPVTFASTTTGICTVSGSTVNFVSAGACTITADQAGNTNYTAAPQVSQNITINKAAQSITFPVIPAQTYAPAGTFAVSATGGASGNVVTFASTTTGVCTVSGSTVSMVSAGACIITADQAGNTNYTAAPQVSQNIAINKATQTITFGANPGPVTFVPASTFTVSATGGASGNAVTFVSTTTGVCTVAGSTVSMVSAGTCTITADQVGNSNYSAAAQVSQNIAINQATQAITAFTTPASVTYTPGGSFTVSATAGASTSPVIFASATIGVCTVSGRTVSILTAGLCTITVNQASDANYLAAPQLSQNITINQATQAITAFTTPASVTYTPGGTFTVSATAGASTSPVIFASTTTGVCSVLGSTVSMVSGGTCTITANQASDANYLAAPQLSHNITINQTTQTISFGANPGPVTFSVGGTFSVSASATSGLAVSYSVPTTTSVCSITGTTVSMLTAGACIITADQAGDTNYTAAPQVNQSITINQAAQTITFPVIAAKTYTPGGTFAVSATGGASGNAVTFASTTTGVCTVAGSTVSIVSAGTCTITADQLGNANYTAAPQVSQNIAINQAAQTIVFTTTPPSVAAAGGAAYTAAATGGASGNAVMFSIDAASGAGVCSIAGATVSFLSNGTCIVDANQAGTTSYAAAAQVQQTIVVQNSVLPTVTAIGGFLSDRNNAIVTNLWDMNSTIDRLNDAPGGGGPSTGLADQDPSTSQPRAMLGGHALASHDSQYGTAIATLDASSASPSADAYGLQQMVYSALRQLGETQSVSQLNYSGPFSAQMSTSGDMTGTFHTSLSQIMKWNDQAQQKEAASMGLKTSGAGPHQFNPLDVWMQGTYAAINSTQQSKFGLLSSGVDYVFNRNLLLGFYGQVDFMNQTTGLQVAGTGWMVGPYGTMRLSDQVFLEARGGYGRSANTMTYALDPSLTDQFGSTRWLASAALAGRWQFGDHMGFKPSFGFTYFTDSTDAYVNGLSVSVPSVTSQLGQFKLSPEVTKGFSLGDANWYEASLAPELIYNFTSTTADGLGSLDPTATGPQGLRGAIKWGLSMKTPSGLTIATQGSYDGIGSSGYSAVTASARLNVPLN